jgi:hypothetical protein
MCGLQKFDLVNSFLTKHSNNWSVYYLQLLSSRPMRKKQIFILYSRRAYFAFFLFILSFCNLPSKAEVTSLPSSVQAEMIDGLFSERAEINDKVEVRLLEPMNLWNDRLFIPVNSTVSGKVEEIQEAGRGLRKGKVKVSFNQIIFPNGYYLNAEGYLMGTKKTVEDEKNKQVKGKATLGEKLVLVGKVGVGALIGGPIGAAAAAGALIFDKGGKVRIKDKEPVFINISRVNFPQNYDVRGEIRLPAPQSPSPSPATDLYSPGI